MLVLFIIDFYYIHVVICTVISRIPSHSRMVVAVPTKKREAFSVPVVDGCSFVSFASGSVEGWSCWSRVGGSLIEGSRVRRGREVIMAVIEFGTLE